ncbi:hypothetical protein AVEN_226992-1 [Araneus ventricosus]|uniref:Uncharacterized protein n=1 Tax=Araneus ventricosus TaxID=182803 RepID=A0A4Y2M0V4_ARAVE|nr:hypothetical protein AVEN_226992-1 [Araneus ventricosus]
MGTSQRATLLDESRCKKHGERFATATTDDREMRALVVIDARSETMLFAALVDIDVYDASGNIVHIADHGRGGLVARPRLLCRRIPGSKPDSTKDLPHMGFAAR